MQSLVLLEYFKTLFFFKYSLVYPIYLKKIPKTQGDRMHTSPSTPIKRLCQKSRIFGSVVVLTVPLKIL